MDGKTDDRLVHRLHRMLHSGSLQVGPHLLKLPQNVHNVRMNIARDSPASPTLPKLAGVPAAAARSPGRMLPTPPVNAGFPNPFRGALGASESFMISVTSR